MRRQRILSAAELACLPPGDRGPRLTMLARDHQCRLDALRRRAPCRRVTLARLRHEKALRMLAYVAESVGLSPTPAREVPRACRTRRVQRADG